MTRTTDNIEVSPRDHGGARGSRKNPHMRAPKGKGGALHQKKRKSVPPLLVKKKRGCWFWQATSKGGKTSNQSEEISAREGWESLYS